MFCLARFVSCLSMVHAGLQTEWRYQLPRRRDCAVRVQRLRLPVLVLGHGHVWAVVVARMRPARRRLELRRGFMAEDVRQYQMAGRGREDSVLAQQRGTCVSISLV